MKKSIITAAVAALFIGVLAIGHADAAEFKPKAEYKMSVNVSPVTPMGIGANYFAEEVKRLTNGQINIKVYWNGQLMSGKATNELLLMRKGVGDFSVSSFINWAPQFPAGNLFLLPFFISAKHDKYAALDAIEAGSAGKMLEAKIDKLGLKVIGWGEQGFRELTNDLRPIVTPADMKDIKFRVVGSPLFIDIFNALGANPMNISWAEALTALQQKTVDGQENPWAMYIPNKIYEFQKYITEWSYNADPLIYCVHNKVWETFPEDIQKIIADTAVKAGQYNKALSRLGLDNGESEKWLKDNNLYPAEADLAVINPREFAKSKGVEITVLTPDQIAAFAEVTKPVFDKWVPKVGDDLVNAAIQDMANIK